MDLRSKGSCEFHNSVKSQQLASETQDEIMDIEDLVRAGKKQKCCPYYLAKDKVKDAEVIFMPYNVSDNWLEYLLLSPFNLISFHAQYLIDPKLHRSDIDMKNAIVILDEAHNVPNVCETSASASIKSTEILAAARDLKFVSFKLDSSGITLSKCDFRFEFPIFRLPLRFMMEHSKSLVRMLKR